MRVDLNADAGESYGRWTIGDDAALFPHITSVNAACGWHGGDPKCMREAVRLAGEHNVGLGAHPGFPDLMGFGRRMMAATHQEVIDMCVYQVGALIGFAKAEGVRLNHIKPHGSLNFHIYADPELALKYAKALLALQSDLIFNVTVGTQVELMRKNGIKVISEAVADMEYNDDGTVIFERITARKDPAYIAKRAVQMASGIIETINGKKLAVKIDTLCLHGDRDNSVEIAKAVNLALKQSGYTLAAPSASAL
ncbi:LamB/YcsF family protein [Agrobacterium sp. NPDC090283]|uniref:LamB/YcsF family protein n=1 Tax=Agrobacterium sp. NPDC090283 TaxID=3363920 RepID=UPI003839D2B3